MPPLEELVGRLDSISDPDINSISIDKDRNSHWKVMISENFTSRLGVGRDKSLAKAIEMALQEFDATKEQNATA